MDDASLVALGHQFVRADTERVVRPRVVPFDRPRPAADPVRRDRQTHTPTTAPMNRVLAVILGGGAGTRLFPLTAHRAKPAVPLAGKYRLVDVPISNCINSGLDRIFVVTQYNSASLNSHIARSYVFDRFRGGFVTILAAEQTMASERWFQGTADAVRQSMLIGAHAQSWLMQFVYLCMRSLRSSSSTA